MNLDLYNKVRVVPQDAQKTIQAGRLKGYTDINPMWRIQVLTEQFGAVGEGWYYDIDKTWSADIDGEIAVFVQISLYYKTSDGWSKPIIGIGGDKLAVKEKDKYAKEGEPPFKTYIDDDCYKKALTDAISTSCKALGIGADIYWNDGSKYTETSTAMLTKDQIGQLVKIANSDTEVIKAVLAKKGFESSAVTPAFEFDNICKEIQSTLKGK